MCCEASASADASADLWREGATEAGCVGSVARRDGRIDVQVGERLRAPSNEPTLMTMLLASSRCEEATAREEGRKGEGDGMGMGMGMA